MKADTVIKVLNDTILAVPKSILTDDEIIGDVIKVNDDALINISDDDGLIYLKMNSGMSVSFSKHCEVIVLPEDKSKKVAIQVISEITE